MSFSHESVEQTITTTVLEHNGSKNALAQSIIGIFSIAVKNERAAWERGNQKKTNKKLKKEAGCCFSICCCKCFDGSWFCKFLIFCLAFGFIVRFVQGFVGYFK